MATKTSVAARGAPAVHRKVRDLCDDLPEPAADEVAVLEGLRDHHNDMLNEWDRERGTGSGFRWGRKATHRLVKGRNGKYRWEAILGR